MSCTIEGGYDTARHDGTMTITITETGGGGHVKAVSLTGTFMPVAAAVTAIASDDFGADVFVTLDYRSATSDLQAGFSTGLASAISVSINANGYWQFASNGAGSVSAIAVSLNPAAQKYFGDTFSGTALVKSADVRALLYMVPAMGGLTDVTLPREVSDGLATDITMNDGTTEGIAMPGAAYEWECVVPLEPRARVWHQQDAGADQTWELFFRLVRNIEPIVVTFDDGSGSDRPIAGRLKADSCNFAPEQLADNYLAYANIRLRQWYVGDIL